MGTRTSDVIKMSVNLPADAVEALRHLAAKRCTTMTDVLRQAIGTERYLEQVAEDGGKVLVEDKRGRIRQLIFRRG